MRKVAWFDNIIQFHRAWNKISHAKIENVLYDITNEKFKIFQDFEG